jgi:hypothetical protein
MTYIKSDLFLKKLSQSYSITSLNRNFVIDIKDPANAENNKKLAIIFLYIQAGLTEAEMEDETKYLYGELKYKYMSGIERRINSLIGSQMDIAGDVSLDIFDRAAKNYNPNFVNAKAENPEEGTILVSYMGDLKRVFDPSRFLSSYVTNQAKSIQSKMSEELKRRKFDESESSDGSAPRDDLIERIADSDVQTESEALNILKISEEVENLDKKYLSKDPGVFEQLCSEVISEYRNTRLDPFRYRIQAKGWGDTGSYRSQFLHESDYLGEGVGGQMVIPYDYDSGVSFIPLGGPPEAKLSELEKKQLELKNKRFDKFREQGSDIFIDPEVRRAMLEDTVKNRIFLINRLKTMKTFGIGIMKYMGSNLFNKAPFIKRYFGSGEKLEQMGRGASSYPSALNYYSLFYVLDAMIGGPINIEEGTRTSSGELRGKKLFSGENPITAKMLLDLVKRRIVAETGIKWGGQITSESINYYKTSSQIALNTVYVRYIVDKEKARLKEKLKVSLDDAKLSDEQKEQIKNLLYSRIVDENFESLEQLIPVAVPKINSSKYPHEASEHSNNPVVALTVRDYISFFLSGPISIDEAYSKGIIKDFVPESQGFTFVMSEKNKLVEGILLKFTKDIFKKLAEMSLSQKTDEEIQNILVENGVSDEDLPEDFKNRKLIEIEADRIEIELNNSSLEEKQELMKKYGQMWLNFREGQLSYKHRKRVERGEPIYQTGIPRKQVEREEISDEELLSKLDMSSINNLFNINQEDSNNPEKEESIASNKFRLVKISNKFKYYD